MFNKTEGKNYFMYQGQLFETAEGEEADIEAMKNGQAEPAQVPEALGSDDDDSTGEDSLQARLARYEAEEDNASAVGTIEWYKTEFDANNVEYPKKKPTLKALQDVFMKWHDDAEQEEPDPDED